ncbi:protein FAM219B [Aythya fuligula]|uniref:Protein FAM219B n=1 Tax=Aythya fuligula TaxID=219594 RepID=A0A6J3DMT5_AYTFU|nr:protein FAM219B [Aythya fuligula]
MGFYGIVGGYMGLYGVLRDSLWGCVPAAIQGCTGPGRGCSGQRPYRGRASTWGGHTTHTGRYRDHTAHTGRFIGSGLPPNSPLFLSSRPEARAGGRALGAAPGRRGGDPTCSAGPPPATPSSVSGLRGAPSPEPALKPQRGRGGLRGLTPLLAERPREPAKAAPRWHGLLGGGPARAAPKRPARSQGGYVALSQVAEDGRLSPSSGSDGELESRGSSGYSSAEVNQELSRQLLRDGYHLDEVPDDEDLDLIPPKPAATPCPWCFGDSLCCVLQ